MCGIAGIIKHTPITGEDRRLLKRMTKRLIHRGPDSEGWLEGESLYFGVRRLSIIDVEGGDQPLFNEDRSLALIANGEIYNFKELRRKLEKKGHHFRTKSDCETICHLYEDYGIKLLKYLRGMFAFALYDKKNSKVFLVRDRIGEKPLFYYIDREQLIFASELKAVIIALPRSKRKIDPTALDLYLHYQFVSEPRTLLKGINKLPPGHFLEIDLISGKTCLLQYWRVSKSKTLAGRPDEAVRRELIRIGKIIGRSDVPVGISLSGGIDSSTVASIITHFSENRNITHAFTIGYEGQREFDERVYARKVAKFLGLELHEVELKDYALSQQFSEYVYASDEPIADIAGFALFNIMKAAHKEGIKVMLSGIGGDELFWGYPWIREVVKKSILKHKLVRSNGLYALLQRATHPSAYSEIKDQPPDQLVFYDQQPDFKYLHQLVGAIYHPQVRERISEDNATLLFTRKEWGMIPETIMKLKIDTWLVSNAIDLSDRLSMANSVELRLPLVDYKLVELAFAINQLEPSLYKKPPKIMLKRAMEGLLPNEILYREKQPFRPPVQEWVHEVHKRFSSLVIGGYLVQNRLLKRKALIELAKPPVSGLKLNFWYKLLILEIWCLLFLERVSPSALHHNK